MKFTTLVVLALVCLLSFSCTSTPAPQTVPSGVGQAAASVDAQIHKLCAKWPRYEPKVKALYQALKGSGALPAKTVADLNRYQPYVDALDRLALNGCQITDADRQLDWGSVAVDLFLDLLADYVEIHGGPVATTKKVDHVAGR